MIPSPAVDFNFDSACTSPYLSAPSSPHRFGTFSGGDTTISGGFIPSTIPFSWEEKPGTPKTKDSTAQGADFEFDFRGHLDRNSVSLCAADELFHGGQIKPLKPPPRLQFTENELVDSRKSPRSPIETKSLNEALSPKHKKKDFDPFQIAIDHTRRENYNQQKGNDRGRERNFDPLNSGRRQKGTRSLSPVRVADTFSESYQQQTSNSSNSSKNSGWKGCTKWKLKDFLLFRSTSEGRATIKDLLKEYSLLKQSNSKTEEVKNSSLRSTESSGSGSRMKGASGPVSAHELHYTANRAVSEETRRKTFLPYNHGLLGCLGFNPAVHDISRGIGSMRRG